MGQDQRQIQTGQTSGERKAGRKVTHLRCSDGIQIGGSYLESITAEKHHAEMELHPAGVLVEMKGRTLLVPYSQIRFAELVGEEG
jgi:hypothetical protein